MATLSSDLDLWTSNAMQNEALENSECISDDDFVHIRLTSSQKGTAMAALSSLLHSEKAIEGDWIALSSPAMKVQALEASSPPPVTSEKSSANTAAGGSGVPRTLSYKNLRTTSTDLAPDIDPTKRETYLSEEEFRSFFGMSKSQFYALPKWKQAQQKLDLDLF